MRPEEDELVMALLVTVLPEIKALDAAMKKAVCCEKHHGDLVISTCASILSSKLGPEQALAACDSIKQALLAQLGVPPLSEQN